MANLINKVTKKSILKIKESIDAYGKEMAAINEKIATIDEKYRKMMEKETKDLRKSYAALEEEQEIWNISLSRYDADIVNEVLGNSSISDDEPTEETVVKTTTEDVAPAEEKVIDTIFEDNNEDENEKKEEETTEVADTEKESVGSVNESIFHENENEPEQLNVVAEGNTDWNDVNEDDIPTAPASDDEWPELPEDWK